MGYELTNEIRLTAIDTFNALKPTQIYFGVYNQAEQIVSVTQQLKVPFSQIKIPKHLKLSGNETLDALALKDGDTVILLQNLGAEFYVILGAI